MVNSMGRQKAVIVRKFVTTDTCDDGARHAFESEVELRRDLLDGVFARMIGISIASQRTKIIVVDAATIAAYDYLEILPGFEYFLEYTRIMCEILAGYRFLREHRVSWSGGYEDVLLNAQDKRLCLGGLGSIDGQWEDSGWRLEEASLRLRDGDDTCWGGTETFEFYANWLEEMREAVTRWNDNKTEENAQNLWDWPWWWSEIAEFERGTENSPFVGEIGWIDGNFWHPIPLVHHFPLAQRQEYLIHASKWRDGELETIVGTRIGEYTRWSIDVSPGETFYLRTFVQTNCTEDICDFCRLLAISGSKLIHFA
ncbi:hypothetical protein SISSUDRAFT_1055470 [Sistotremastrum suecicum HHB10207 ss-3]|uniref:Uncharacterized protein n=1 Tax=Sistotremastrum suecicum HHB10207 ss-3 TaxID=1314776 RepID=A0A165XRU3_9AGAM|nr:hypothetical protein SISSUDRAFT_1055470 [Sistotremastrum suecicum HHB10207 ss-3]